MAGTYQYELIAGMIGIGSCEAFLGKWEKVLFGEELVFHNTPQALVALLGVNHQGTSRAPLVKASLNIRILCVL